MRRHSLIRRQTLSFESQCFIASQWELFSFPADHAFLQLHVEDTFERGEVRRDTNINIDGTERTNNNHDSTIKLECNY